MKGSQNIGLFGGVFDPPHIGHLIIAQYVLDEQKLDKILFIPAGQPPHKYSYSPYDVRYAMIKAAIRNNPRFCMSAVEKNMKGKTYTIEVIKKIRKRVNGSLFLIIGSDQWEEIDTWKDPDDLFQACSIIIVPRPGYNIKRERTIRGKIAISRSPLIAISSTLIRERIMKRKSIRYLVPPAVERYIIQTKLYR